MVDETTPEGDPQTDGGMDIEIPEADEILEGGGASRISVRLGGLEVEIEGNEEETLKDVKSVYDEVLEDVLTRSENASNALRDRMLAYR